MTQEEMWKQIVSINKRAELEKKRVYFQFVKENAKYRIGDIVSDSTDTIRIESISFSLYNNVPSIYYVGPLLTKKGQPRKDGETRCIYESVIK